MRSRLSHQAFTRGFTLIELAIVIVIIAVISGLGLMATLGTKETANRVGTEKKLDVIEQALTSFRATYNRLPCPASVTLPNTDTNYGKEGAATYPTTSTAATSYNCITGTPHANFYWGAATNSVPQQYVEGTVPVRTLNLPDEFMYDSWGRHIAYAVDAYATVPNAFKTMRPLDQCVITVDDASHTARTSGAVYLLFSYGPDGHGAFINSTTRQTVNSVEVDQLRNCHCTASGTTDSTMSYSP
jgi:prepilin-type N-terminal cleavage/methylation domain-containing protein